jgi:hypothetical protein
MTVESPTSLVMVLLKKPRSSRSFGATLDTASPLARSARWPGVIGRIRLGQYMAFHSLKTRCRKAVGQTEATLKLQDALQHCVTQPSFLIWSVRGRNEFRLFLGWRGEDSMICCGFHEPDYFDENTLVRKLPCPGTLEFAAIVWSYVSNQFNEQLNLLAPRTVPRGRHIPSSRARAFLCHRAVSASLRFRAAAIRA